MIQAIGQRNRLTGLGILKRLPQFGGSGDRDDLVRSKAALRQPEEHSHKNCHFPARDEEAHWEILPVFLRAFHMTANSDRIGLHCTGIGDRFQMDGYAIYPRAQ